MNVYLESSAVLRDLLDGDQSQEVRSLLANAELVTTSRLTLAEVGRVLARLRVTNPVVAARVAGRESAFYAESELWAVHSVDESVWERCGRPFPVEPIRTLDAIHLATIEALAAVVPDLVVISTDDRVRSNAVSLGFTVRP